MDSEFPAVLDPLWVSLRTVVCATAVTLVLGVLAARWRSHCKGVFWEVMDAVLLFPLALPPTVVGLVLLLIFGRQSPIGQFLHTLGFQVLFTWQATVIAAVAVSFPLMYHSAKGAFALIDRELLDAARVFGYGERRILWQVMIPLAWPGILAGLVLAFVRALGEFGATLMLAGNIPGRTQTLPIAIFFFVEGGNFTGAVILSLIIVAISATALLLLNRISRRD